MRRGFRIGSWDGYVRLGRVSKMKGMCSNLASGNHILMWDFDDVPLKAVVAVLRKSIEVYDLSDIMILETKEDTNYIAYCFTECKWKEALRIVLDTPLVCWNFWRLSVIRGYFTLRISEKGGRIPIWRATLPGTFKADVGINDLVHAITYETGKGR